MDIDILEEFITIYETLSFQETSDRLNISQSALTKHIHKLEEELGVALFNRSTRSVKANEYSQIFYPYAEQIVRTAKEGTSSLQSLAHHDESKLSLAFTNTCSQYGIIELISNFSKKYPQYQMRISESFHINDILLGHQCDFAFANDAVSIDDRLSKIVYKVDHLAAYIPVDDPLALLDKIDILSLKNEKIITHARASGAYHHDTLRFLSVCKANGFMPDTSISASYTSVIMQLVKEGQGIAVLFRNQLPVDQIDANIAILDIEPSIESTIYLLYDCHQRRTSARREFLKYLLHPDHSEE